MDRLERLVNLVAALLEAPRPLTREEIRERVPGYAGDETAFRRTFERDKESIRQMGIPLSVEQVDPSTPDSPEGYRIRREHYELPDPGLHPDELAALHLAASAVRLEGTAGTEALWKLGGAEDGAGGDTPPVDLPGHDDLTVLFAAIAERRRAMFRYNGKPREVDPYQLSFRNGHWYLRGFDHGRGEERSFRLDRFESAAAASDEAGAFARPSHAGRRPVKPWEMGDGAAVVAHVLVDADHATWAIADAGPEAVCERRPDGSVVLALQVTNPAALRSFVLGFLEHAELLDPPELRDDLRAWLEEIAARAPA